MMTKIDISQNLKEEYNYFEAHREEFSKKYPNLYLIIQNKQVQFALNTLSEAIDKASEQGFKEGTYLLQFCDQSGKKFVCTYRSRNPQILKNLKKGGNIKKR